MRAGVGLALAVVLLTTSGCSFYLYERGMVRRIDVTKEVGAPALEAEAVFSAAVQAVTVTVRQTSDVQLARTVKYNTILWEGGYVPWFEPIEFIFFPLLLPLYAALVYADVVPPPSKDLIVPDQTKLELATAMVNPAMSLMGVDIIRTENTDIEVFADKPVEISFPMRLPVKAVEVSYRLLDAAGAEVGTGTATTDVYGEVVISGLEARPAKIELKAPGLEATLTL